MDFPDLESSSLSIPCSYSPLPRSGDRRSSALPTPPSPLPHRRPSRWLPLAISAVLLLGSAALVFYQPNSGFEPGSPSDGRAPGSRGAADGVSEKSTASLLAGFAAYPWTNDMLQWQRSSFHFQPQKNWMNDPDGPMYYKGCYHLFYQYNRDSALWGNITWGHAVSNDLLHWLHLPIAMIPDHWYDGGGVWTGSATLLPSGEVIMLYTGSTNDSVQVQNLATPADPSDPLLLNWVKSESNPVVLPPAGVGPKDFRDPTTAWLAESDSSWRVAIGSKDSNHTGIALVYKTKDFINYDLIPGYLHSVAGTGMWECVDFYPVSPAKAVGLDTSAVPGKGVRHVLKASLDDDKRDYYAIGLYDEEANEWTPDDPELDVGIGLRHDYGKFYASKTFYDPVKRRRILWGWTGETDSERADLLKGWASLQSIPRTVVFDTKTGSNLLQWPVEETESLRTSSQNFSSVSIDTGSVVPLDIGTGTATQLDIVAEFEIEASASARTVEADVGYNCSTGGGAAGRGLLGPFGLLVLADEDRSEQTAVYFYIGRGGDGNLRTFFCQDETRSSKASDIVKRVYGSTVPVLHGETLSMRILVDHSIVESFAQGGRTCITSRVYPTKAIYNTARVFLFNNATGSQVTAKSLTIWQMNSTFIHPYSLQATS